MTTTITVVSDTTPVEVTRECPLCEIDLEEGDTSEFTALEDPDGDISVTSAAALANTNYGIAFLIDDANPVHGDKTLSVNSITGVMRLRLYIDPHSLTLGDGSEFPFVYVTSSSLIICSLYLNYSSGYRIQAGIYKDTVGVVSSSYYAITDAPHYIEILLVRATTDVSSDGYLQLWIDGVSQETIPNIDNYDRFNDFGGFAVGVISGAYFSGSNSGTFYLDEIIVNETGTLIGAR